VFVVASQSPSWKRSPRKISCKFVSLILLNIRLLSHHKCCIKNQFYVYTIYGTFLALTAQISKRLEQDFTLAVWGEGVGHTTDRMRQKIGTSVWFKFFLLYSQCLLTRSIIPNIDNSYCKTQISSCLHIINWSVCVLQEVLYKKQRNYVTIKINYTINNFLSNINKIYKNVFRVGSATWCLFINIVRMEKSFWIQMNQPTRCGN
jgi:hypothetical protein